MTTRKTHQDGYMFRRGRYWVIRYRVRTADGQWKHKAETVYSKRKKDASDLLDERLRLINAGATVPESIRFSDFVENHWAKYTNERWKSSTRATLGSFVSHHLVPYFGGFTLADIGPVQVQEFMDAKRREGLSDKTRLNLWSLLERMFNVAIGLDLLSATPMRKKISKPRVPKREKPILSPEEVHAVVKTIAARYKVLACVVTVTGIRLGEALGLQWRDVDFEKSKLQICRSVWRGTVQTPKSAATVRAKHLTPTLAALLRTQKGTSFYTAPEDFVFASARGTPLNPDNCRHALYSALEAAGVKRVAARAYGFHLLRHTAGSMMYTATGGDLKQTQRYMGHSHIGVTADTYIHLDTDSELEAALRLEQLILSKEVRELCSNCAQRRDAVN